MPLPAKVTASVTGWRIALPSQSDDHSSWHPSVVIDTTGRCLHEPNPASTGDEQRKVGLTRTLVVCRELREMDPADDASSHLPLLVQMATDLGYPMVSPAPGISLHGWNGWLVKDGLAYNPVA